ncbi:peroxiredoxin [Enhygromyxa salina]|uniref:thioredoxin-dependent peroxiredoxin n=1 Tax=Enhygromyxa salina TaxID=215803 RepID=A0A2S9XQL3_9BACT|nr:peroxiredoxin [Enhygromyxa salina]PRP95159.1 putative peroxiredoxin bcp [Enhygromyxa salina]
MRNLATPLALLLLCLAAPIVGTACGETERPDGGTGLLAVGAQAPALEATAHDGTTLELGSLGKPAVVYFYPADNTPGCTKEACAFRDIWTEYEAAGVMVIGVSTQDNASHIEFAEEHAIPFPLIADTDKTWATGFGVKLRGGYAERVSFLLDRNAKIVAVYPGVDPGVHAREVLDAAAKL